MDIESLKIKTKTNYDWDDIVYIYDIGYVLEPDYGNTINPLYFVINRLFGHIEEIEGSSERYLLVNINDKKKINVLMNYRNLLKIKLILIK